MRYQLVLLAVCTLVGCAAPRPVSLTTITIDSPYDSAGAVKMLQAGNNTIKGNAFMLLAEGGAATCVGQYAQLVPATEYTKVRMKATYSSLERGLNKNVYLIFNPDLDEFKVNQRSARCDSQGMFIFDGVADGDFFVITQVEWQVGNYNQGGILMQRVRTQGGKTNSITMTNLKY